MSISPVPMRWDGEAMVPTPGFAKQADEQYVVGQTYRMVPENERSKPSHDHFFVTVGELWDNLPEPLAERFPTADHLRKHALIMAGYRDEVTYVAGSKAEAQRVAALLRPLDDYAIVTVRDAVVTRYTAKSQSLRAMGRDEFQASKDRVLTIIHNALGVEAPRAAA